MLFPLTLFCFNASQSCSGAQEYYGTFANNNSCITNPYDNTKSYSASGDCNMETYYKPIPIEYNQCYTYSSALSLFLTNNNANRIHTYSSP
eukprot:Pgem_evm1s421